METRITFGSSTSPCRTVSQEDQVLEEKGSCDPDKIIQCPYDKNHQIRNSRFPYHILKCRKNHPKLANELRACPFNARHLVPKQELAQHIEMCENRRSPEESEEKDEDCAWRVPVRTRENPCKTEDWDMEADDHAVPFVWGVTPQMNQQPVNNLPQGLRAPNALPWESFKQ
ncbi:gametocyte-specific factor 1 [Oryzias melastigma]|uniref:Gametocyte-specific factor 1-like n=1 Tax=Oryzias melastigma TaxID=30732 RepID=A0A3B3CS53_ORYME|nr:gametocyte-specific factor 1 [Oryzias melastigma]XP_024149079.1 gametocyte-specific factor 1 [Oryzias melastigma]